MAVGNKPDKEFLYDLTYLEYWLILHEGKPLRLKVGYYHHLLDLVMGLISPSESLRVKHENGDIVITLEEAGE